MKKIVFLTGTRADFGKIKSLLNKIEQSNDFELAVFVTGMHLLKKYGGTVKEVQDAGYSNIHTYINQNLSDSMDIITSKTISGFSDFVKEFDPDMIVVHGDRVEALAGAIVGSLNNIYVAHIEGGEVSGTIDELIRHSVSKLSHFHFVANEEAKHRLLQLGERNDSIFVIGSPDIDIMLSDRLPSLDDVRDRYDIQYSNYSVVMLHPVTTELDSFREKVDVMVDTINNNQKNYVVIYPNNDLGSSEILKSYESFKGNSKVVVFPSMRFEYFLTMLKHADFIMGNSSAGVREAHYYNVPCINIGSRQNKRAQSRSIINCDFDADQINRAISKTSSIKFDQSHVFGSGDSANKFFSIISSSEIWSQSSQKYFNDLELQSIKKE